MSRLFGLLAALVLYGALHINTAAAAEIELMPGLVQGQKAILVRGAIEEGDDSRFFDIAKSTPRATVLLESPGGLVTTGLSIAAEIALRGYTTLVLDGEGCHSICAVIWVAAVRRYMSPNANISVHAAYRMREDSSGDAEISESGVANAQIGAFLNEAGLSADAISYFTFAGPHEKLLEITPKIAQTLSIDVYIQMPDRTVTPSERPTPRRITRQVSEYMGMADNCSLLFRLKSSFWNDESQIVLQNGINLFGSQAFTPLLGEYAYNTQSAIEDLGTVRWCLLAERNLRQDGLKTGIMGPNYDCSKSSTRTEFAICTSNDLWAMDRVMASLYFYFRENTDVQRSQEFLSSQRDWLARRDQCQEDLDCLFERYSSRLFDFGV